MSNSPSQIAEKSRHRSVPECNKNTTVIGRYLLYSPLARNLLAIKTQTNTGPVLGRRKIGFCTIGNVVPGAWGVNVSKNISKLRLVYSQLQFLLASTPGAVLIRAEWLKGYFRLLLRDAKAGQVACPAVQFQREALTVRSAEFDVIYCKAD